MYESFFKPYIAKHETEIDRNLLELRTRAGDMASLHLCSIFSCELFHDFTHMPVLVRFPSV